MGQTDWVLQTKVKIVMMGDLNIPFLKVVTGFKWNSIGKSKDFSELAAKGTNRLFLVSKIN
jgi:hypothetical protein